MNKVIMMIRFCENPELKTDKNGKYYVRFRGACQRDDGSNEADFFNFIAFNRRAEFIVKHFSKGFRVAIVGEIHNDKPYEKEDGTKVHNDTIWLEHVDFADGRSDEKEADIPDAQQGNQQYGNAPQNAQFYGAPAPQGGYNGGQQYGGAPQGGYNGGQQYGNQYGGQQGGAPSPQGGYNSGQQYGGQYGNAPQNGQQGGYRGGQQYGAPQNRQASVPPQGYAPKGNQQYGTPQGNQQHGAPAPQDGQQYGNVPQNRQSSAAQQGYASQNNAAQQGYAPRTDANQTAPVYGATTRNNAAPAPVSAPVQAPANGRQDVSSFVNIPDNVVDEELPFT